MQFADGTADYARLLCMHDGAFNVKEGQLVKQGEYFYDEGGMGAGNPNKFANHVHIEAGKGRWKSTTQSPNVNGTYVIEKQAHLYDLFTLGADVHIAASGGYSWKREQPAESCAQCENLKGQITQLKQIVEKIRTLTEEANI